MTYFIEQRNELLVNKKSFFKIYPSKITNINTNKKNYELSNTNLDQTSYR
jgi:hypothetical protein